MGEMGVWSNDWNHIFSFIRDSTYLGSPAAGSRLIGIGLAGITFSGDNQSSTNNSSPFIQYLDTPATTAQITYKLSFMAAGVMTLYNNTTVSDADNVAYKRGMSMITAMEIAA